MDNFTFRHPRPYFINRSRPTGFQDWSAYSSYLHTNKTLNANAGTWEVQLTPNAQYGEVAGITTENFESAVYRLFKPMDVC